jgi:hypothetical protein
MKQTLNDQEIRTLAAIIDVASTRGAFKGQELAGVGTLYNKLMSMAQPQPQPQPGDSNEEAEKETK